MSKSIQTGDQRIVSAPWIVTMEGAAIRDGAVLLGGGRIQKVGEVSLLSSLFPEIEVEYFAGAFIPALINAHTHLELSHLSASKPLAAEKTFTDWVEDLLGRRFDPAITDNMVQELATQQVAEQYESGVVFMGDIGNTTLGRSLVANEEGLPEIYHMLELLGSSKEAVEIANSRLEELSHDTAVVPHAPYSTRPELLKTIKQRCDDKGFIFSVHTAEVSSENTFINGSSGLFYDFLVKRGVQADEFFEDGENAGSTIEYFSHLDLLNEKTLLVHCVHVSKADLKLIKKSGAHICVCPGSNDFLHSGKPPIEEMICSGVLPAIGTDSAASNLQLDMWEEMKRLYIDYTSIKESEILAMATKAGARAFGQSEKYGTITEGKSSSFLHIYSDKIKNCITESDLLNMLVSNGRPERIEWIQQTFVNTRSN